MIRVIGIYKWSFHRRNKKMPRPLILLNVNLFEIWAEQKIFFLDKNKDFRDSTSRNLWKALLIFTYCLVSNAFFHFDLNHRHLFLLSLNKIWLANASLPRHKILNLINHFDLNCLINLCWWVNDIQNMNFLIFFKTCHSLLTWFFIFFNSDCICLQKIESVITKSSVVSRWLLKSSHSIFSFNFCNIAS